MHGPDVAMLDSKSDGMIETVQKYDSKQHFPWYRLHILTFVGHLNNFELGKILLSLLVHPKCHYHKFMVNLENFHCIHTFYRVSY